MRLLAILLSFFLLVMLTVPASAGHSTGNGTCEDDKTHYDNMVVNGKRSDAPLYAESQEQYQIAISKHNSWTCERYMEEALRMIRKTNGEYPTE